MFAFLFNSINMCIDTNLATGAHFLSRTDHFVDCSDSAQSSRLEFWLFCTTSSSKNISSRVLLEFLPAKIGTPPALFTSAHPSFGGEVIKILFAFLLDSIDMCSDTNLASGAHLISTDHFGGCSGSAQCFLLKLWLFCSTFSSKNIASRALIRVYLLESMTLAVGFCFLAHQYDIRLIWNPNVAKRLCG